tara:strand:+ start:37 stop:408 length:372 start_codon:yes stop_codon:yes gene_type:complete
MKIFEQLSENNFMLFAAQNYYNPAWIDAEEFDEDLKRFKYIKRLLTRYNENKVLQVNLLLNHLIVIFNVFGIQGGLRMLEYKIYDDNTWKLIKPFLIHLNVIENTSYVGIEMDENIVAALRNL